MTDATHGLVRRSTADGSVLKTISLTSLHLDLPSRRPSIVYSPAGAVTAVTLLGSFGAEGNCTLAALDLLTGAALWRWGGGCPAGQIAFAGGALVFSRRLRDGGGIVGIR